MEPIYLPLPGGIHPGIWVPAGKLLGLVGNSGDALNTATHLHFEISSANSPNTLIDPFQFLTAWHEDQNITPTLPIP